MRSLICCAALILALVPAKSHSQQPGNVFHFTGFGQGGGRQSLSGYFDIPAGAQPDKCHVCLKVGDDCIARWFADATSTKIRFEFSLPSSDYSRAVLVLTDCPLTVKSVDEFKGRPIPFFIEVKLGNPHSYYNPR
jgi:hypothetical protein